MSSDPDAARIAAAVRALPEVVGLHGGRFGEVATFTPPHRTVGVRVREDEVTVGVVVGYPFTAGRIAQAVRGAVGGAGAAGVPVHVVIGDLVEPGLPHGEYTGGALRESPVAGDFAEVTS
ncbi:hypothetical protein SK571_16465 [Lentzea sp. BCCO 10_0798]|uniref:Asp23 family, cell envelope-related function n=1 Tax=Lentzea kristufekii TaxID=3095430 RepID=A0ABU4TST7_9PSEU|nr:hypothetical protein [Lentzea sp. BCCO 10_0798]MDX8050982.1 hypothetical protein [Lentzea sp. BCCO 10_0798]